MTDLRSTDPKLSARFETERVVFSGGRYGDHSLVLVVSSPERIAAHWAGYCEANDARALAADGRPEPDLVRVRLTPGEWDALVEPLHQLGGDDEPDVARVLARVGRTYVDVNRADDAEARILLSALELHGSELEVWEPEFSGWWEESDRSRMNKCEFGLRMKRGALDRLDRKICEVLP